MTNHETNAVVPGARLSRREALGLLAGSGAALMLDPVRVLGDGLRDAFDPRHVASRR